MIITFFMSFVVWRRHLQPLGGCRYGRKIIWSLRFSIQHFPFAYYTRSDVDWWYRKRTSFLGVRKSVHDTIYYPKPTFLGKKAITILLSANISYIAHPQIITIANTEYGTLTNTNSSNVKLYYSYLYTSLCTYFHSCGFQRTNLCAVAN